MARLFVVVVSLLLASSALCGELEYAPAGCGNPLQGLVPYAEDWAARDVHGDGRVFPHSLEFTYIGLAKLAPKQSTFDFGPLDETIDAIAARGHQAVFRVYMEYPGRTDGIPEWLEASGVNVTRWSNPEAGAGEKGIIATPDYDDPKTVALLTDFIAAMGRRYDGDARVGYITAGLLGTWGEWHTYPRDDLFASKETQSLVLDAYEKAFTQTPVLLRYPAGDDAWQQTANASRPFGYHDDSFAWATLETGRKADDWFFMHLLTAAGADAKWKTQPIGGEVRPELWGKIFEAPTGQPKAAHRKAQDFVQCVETTHATWLMESGMFERKLPKGKKGQARWDGAREKVARLGYEFHVSRAEVRGGLLRVTIRNTGVAPLYHDWRPVLLAGKAKLADAEPIPTDWPLTNLLPGRSLTFPIEWPEDAGQAVQMQIPNALPSGPPIRFANKTQDRDIDGWLAIDLE